VFRAGRWQNFVIQDPHSVSLHTRHTEETSDEDSKVALASAGWLLGAAVLAVLGAQLARWAAVRRSAHRLGLYGSGGRTASAARLWQVGQH
jgi:hypothetical protein